MYVKKPRPQRLVALTAALDSVVSIFLPLQPATAGEALAEVLPTPRTHRDHQAYLAAKALESSLRNPDSLSFESILASDDGNVVCMKYRAQNGFGGMNLGYVVFKDGEPSEKRAAWQSNCAHKVLNDLTAVKDLI